MSDENGTTAPAGWYPDPAGEAERRWWDGSAWTEHTGGSSPSASGTATPRGEAEMTHERQHERVATPSSPPPGDHADRAGGTDAGRGVDAHGLPLAPAGVRTSTVWAWLLALVPLLLIPPYAALDWAAYFRASLRLRDDPSVSLAQLLPQHVLVEYTVLLAVGFGTYLLMVVLARLDWGALRRRGVVRPFHWAWSFLHPLVYLIGRLVVLHRRARGGTAALVVAIVVLVVLVVAIVVIVLVQAAPVIETMSVPTS